MHNDPNAERSRDRYTPGPYWIAGIVGTVSFRVGERLFPLSGSKVERDRGRRENKRGPISVGH